MQDNHTYKNDCWEQLVAVYKLGEINIKQFEIVLGAFNHAWHCAEIGRDFSKFKKYMRATDAIKNE
jgi:hypothetical protein